MHRLGWTLLLFGAGCSSDGDAYPPNLQYPPRTDPLVVAPPTVAPKEPIAAGTLNESVAALKGLPGARLLSPADLASTDRDSITQALDTLFGTPAAPTVGGESVDAGAKLFRKHCAQCHGLAGDGRGPTGLWISPTPRDFRRGLFKFVSTPRKPTRDDLIRTLRHGLPGTAMPAFGMLGDDALGPLADYVRHLSVRGETEYTLIAGAITDELDQAVPEAAKTESNRLIEEWKSADANVVTPTTQPEPDADAVRRGWQLFTAKDGAGCIACHADYGRTAERRYDLWGTQVRPANLTEPSYKGGDRPIDIYRRVRCGIVPATMPAVPHLTEAQTWDLVHFVRALPYRVQLPPDVREKVYPPGNE